MPITRLRTAANPYSPLAWKTSVAILALQKLRKLKPIGGDELAALNSVAEQLDLFSKASEINLSDKEGDVSLQNQPRLRTSFFTLRAIQGQQAKAPIKPPQFKQAGEEIHQIYRVYSESNDPTTLDQSILKTAQGLCLDLLEHLNRQRPSTAPR